MPAFRELTPGTTVDSAPLELTSAMLTDAVALAGYVHPLFTDPAHAEASPFGTRPAPGALLLLLLGGLAEQTPLFDEHVVALVGFDEVRFLAPAVAGTRLRGRFEVLDREPAASGNGGMVRWRWSAVDDADGRELCRLIARFRVHDRTPPKTS